MLGTNQPCWGSKPLILKFITAMTIMSYEVFYHVKSQETYINGNNFKYLFVLPKLCCVKELCKMRPIWSLWIEL